eukprot:1483711-Pleurochrysis_carterae.AAC.1
MALAIAIAASETSLKKAQACSTAHSGCSKKGRSYSKSLHHRPAISNVPIQSQHEMRPVANAAIVAAVKASCYVTPRAGCRSCCLLRRNRDIQKSLVEPYVYYH